MFLINNVTRKLVDDLAASISAESQVQIAMACFSMYAYEALKGQLESIEDLRFIFISPAFLLLHSKDLQAVISGKPKTDSGEAADVYYHTRSMPKEKLTLTIRGHSMETVYENLVREISGSRFADGPDEESMTIGEVTAQDNRRQKLERQIAVLQNKIRNEPQFNEQALMAQELRDLQKKLICR